MDLVIDGEEFAQTKYTSEQCKDNEQKWRALLIDYINDMSDSNDDEFFYNMLPFVRFIDVPEKEAAAYTTPYKEICMNAPKGFGIGKKTPSWEFIYDHECLHQLWDTFAVGDKIKASGMEYNHELLNIASDCIINDYLHQYRQKKYPTEGLITPEFIQKEFGVVYDRNTDSQFRLYKKIIESPKYQQHKKEMEKKMKDAQKNQPNQDGEGKPQPPQGGSTSSQQQQGQGQQGQGQQGQGQQGQGQQGQGQQGQSQQGGQQGGQGGSGNQQVSKDYAAGWAKAMADYKAGRLKL